jgi:hypothetical protein
LPKRSELHFPQRQSRLANLEYFSRRRKQAETALRNREPFDKRQRLQAIHRLAGNSLPLTPCPGG